MTHCAYFWVLWSERETFGFFGQIEKLKLLIQLQIQTQSLANHFVQTVLETWRDAGTNYFHLKYWAPNKSESVWVSDWLGPFAGEQPVLKPLERQVEHKLSLFDSDCTSLPDSQVKWFFNLFSGYGQCECNYVKSNTWFELLSHLFADQSVLAVLLVIKQNFTVYYSVERSETLWPGVAQHMLILQQLLYLSDSIYYKLDVYWHIIY